MQHSGTVIQLSLDLQRQSGYRCHRQACADGKQRLQCVQRSLLQNRLQQQITAGIAGQAQLRQHQKANARRRSSLHGSGALLRIVAAIGDPQSGACRSDLDKSVFHGLIPADSAASSLKEKWKGRDLSAAFADPLKLLYHF